MLDGVGDYSVDRLEGIQIWRSPHTSLTMQARSPYKYPRGNLTSMVPFDVINFECFPKGTII